MCFRILVVDDEPFIVDGVAKMIRELKDFQVVVERYDSSEDALRALIERPCDLMIADIEMPCMNGLELLQKARAAGVQTRAILLTGYFDYEYMRGALRQGTYDYVLKLNGIKALRESVVRALTEMANENSVRAMLSEGRSWEAGQALLEGAFSQNERPDSACTVALDWRQIPTNPTLPFLVLAATDDAVRRGKHQTEAVYLRVSRYLAERTGAPACAAPLSGIGYCWVLQDPGAPDCRALADRVRVLLDELSRSMRRALGCSLRFVLDDRAVCREELASSYERLIHRVVAPETALPQRAARVNDAVDTLERYIDAHITEDLSLSELSKVIHLNPSYLSRLFRRVTGQRLSDYVITARMNQARKLLTTTDLRIQDISERVGLQNVPYFTTVFKRIVGCSPQAYRSQSVRNDSML